jgi:NADH-quinone oxidoreductase subunit C
MNIEKIKQAMMALAPAAAPVPEPEPPGEGAEAAPAAKPGRSAVMETDYVKKGFNLDIELPPDKVVAAAEILFGEGLTIEAVTGVDWIKDGQLEVVYDYIDWVWHGRIVVRSRVPRDNPHIPTISEVYPGANWHERETHDFFGIKFDGHPDLSPLLLPEDADFHPLLKDFKV